MALNKQEQLFVVLKKVTTTYIYETLAISKEQAQAKVLTGKIDHIATTENTDWEIRG